MGLGLVFGVGERQGTPITTFEKESTMETTARQDDQTGVPLSLLSHEEAQRWIDSFLVKCEETLSVETIDTYRRKLRLFMQWWSTASPKRALTVQLAYAYGNYRTGLPGSVRSHALHLAVVKRWGSYLVTAGRVSHNPWTSVVAPRQPVWLATDWLTFPEIKRLLQSFDRTSRSQQRDAIIARLMLKTAAREHELAMADIKDIRLLATSTRKSTLRVRTDGIERLPHAIHIKMVTAIGIHVLVEQRSRERERGLVQHMTFGPKFLNHVSDVEGIPGDHGIVEHG